MEEGSVLIKIHHLAISPHQPINRYIKDIGNIDNPSTWKFVQNKKKAQRYKFEEAFELYTKISVNQPLRADGKPNRPLTAFTIGFEPN